MYIYIQYTGENSVANLKGGSVAFLPGFGIASGVKPAEGFQGANWGPPKASCTERQLLRILRMVICY